MNPLLLVDVDGVLRPWGWGNEERIFDTQENARRLQTLAKRFDLAWCTDWQDRANEVMAPRHGLPKLPVVRSTSGYHQIHWKLDWIEAFVGERPYAFVDDDISDLGLLYASWRNMRVPTLWLPVDPSIGLTDDHVEQLGPFADTCALYSEECALGTGDSSS